MRFYLGTHEPGWLSRLDVPLFVSARRLRRQTRWRRALGRWALDSGGFTELSMHGRWTVAPAVYAREVDSWAETIGGLDWAAPQDWMCEPAIRAATGRDVAWHQAATIESVQALRELVRSVPVIPVVQGWAPPDYLRHVEAYARAGLDLTREAVVGIGTVCRRQSSSEGAAIVRSVAAMRIPVHGFGFKSSGLRAVGHLLASADSLAWSYSARRSPPLPGCSHRSCANCMKFALSWRQDLLGSLQARGGQQRLPW
jgi:hypothetical protein